MATKKRKTNWQYILIITILAAVAGGVILFLEYFWLQQEPSVLESFIVHEPIATPTAIDPNFLTQVNKCFLPTAAVYGYALRITDGFRSLDEQEEVYNQGRTENGHIVSWAPAGKSLHNYGFAVDVADRWRGYNINWKRLGQIAAFCGLEQVDDPHFEHRSGLTTDQFATGMRPAPLTLPCALMDERAQANQPLTLKDLKNCGAPKF
jgi:hypothetical protein